MTGVQTCALPILLVTAQTSGVDNGIYVCATSAWARAKDFDGARDVVTGTLVLTEPGTGPAQMWEVTTSGAITIGTTSITFEQHTPEELALRTDLANTASGSLGDALVGVLNTATAAVATTQHEVNQREINVFDFLSTAQKADVIAGGFTLDCRAAVQAAVAAAIAGGFKKIRAPGKGYLINAVASSDTKENGILIPFSAVNFDPADQLIFEGDGAGTVFRCGTIDMVMFRVSRNCTVIRDLTIDGNSLADTWGIGIIPESMTQTSTLVSQSMCSIVNVSRVNLTEGIVTQPGPQVGGADSGCFYLNVIDGISNSNTRHFWAKKNVDWATHPNWLTRSNFIGQRVLRGNTGYQFDDGSEILLTGCYEEIINTGTTPNATPTGRYIAAECDAIGFIGGHQETVTLGVKLFASNTYSIGFSAAGANTDWRLYAKSLFDSIDESVAWTPLLVSSGAGSPSNDTSTGMSSKSGKIVHFTAQISCDKNSLGAGTLSISGLPFIADASWTGADFQGISVTKWANITLSANVFNLAASISGATLSIRKLHAAGAGVAALTVAECTSNPIQITVQGWYKTA